jgi:hypothetical protein
MPWQPTTYPWFVQTTSINPVQSDEGSEEIADDEKPDLLGTGYTAVRLALSSQDKADLEAMIRRVVREEVDAVVRDVLSDRDEAERRERWCDEW